MNTEVLDDLNYIQLLADCKFCNCPSIIAEPISLDHFKGVKPLCCHCRKPLDLWTIILQAIREPSLPAKVFTLIGARWTIIKIILHPNYPTKLNFANYSIPTDAKIIDVIFPGQDVSGRLFPVITEGNENIPPRPVHRLIPTDVNVYPCFFGGEQMAEAEIPVGLIVTWIPHTASDAAWQNLIYGFDAYTHENYDSMFVPANVAVETTLNRLLTEFFKKFASSKKVEDFLTNGATYSHQLNVLLPALLSFKDVPELSECIRGQLNRLRGFRNQVGHAGSCKTPLSKKEASELLCASLLGFHYLNLVEPILLS